MNDPHPMSLQCGDCGQRVHNDDPELAHPIEFIRAVEARGWSVPVNPSGPPKCPSCIAKTP